MVFALCACSAPTSGPALTADVEYPRLLQADRWVELQVAGGMGDEWEVTDARLESGLFDGLAATPSNVRLFENYIAHVKVPLGAATCPASEGGAVAHLTLQSKDGAVAHETVTLPLDVLKGINAQECATRAVTDVAAPSLGGPESASGTSVRTTLTLTRAAGGDGSGGAVSLTAMAGSVVFDLWPAGGASLPVTLPSGDEALTIPVELVATRCEPHVFAESKKTFVFAVWMSVDGGDERFVELRPGGTLQAALQAAFETCGAELGAQTPGGT